MSQSDIEDRLRSTLSEWDSALETAHPIPQNRSITANEVSMAGARAHGNEYEGSDRPIEANTRRQRLHVDSKVLVLVGCAIVLILVGVGFGIGSGRSHKGKVSTSITKPTTIPTSTIPPATILQNAVNSTVSGSTTVTRSAIKTMPLGTIVAALGAAGQPQNQLYAKGVPLTPSDEVDVVALGGSFFPPGANQRLTWEIQIIDPATGWVASERASASGTWPPFFDALPG